jgi:hypothetical protein
MKPSPTMRTVIHELARVAGMALKDGAYFKLEQAGYDPLVVEVHGQRVSVSHYFEQNGDLMSDPDMVFLVGPDGEWYPVEITQSPVGVYCNAVLEWDALGWPAQLYPRAQAGMASFARTWARNIREQGWERATLTACKGR